MQTISFDHYDLVELRVGTIVRAEAFAKARKAAYKVWVDFGDEIGIKKSSAQITDLYTLDSLIGKQVIGVINFPARQVADFMSEFLLTGFYNKDGAVVLAIPEQSVANGEKLN